MKNYYVTSPELDANSVISRAIAVENSLPSWYKQQISNLPWSFVLWRGQIEVRMPFLGSKLFTIPLQAYTRTALPWPDKL